MLLESIKQIKRHKKMRNKKDYKKEYESFKKGKLTLTFGMKQDSLCELLNIGAPRLITIEPGIKCHSHLISKKYDEKSSSYSGLYSVKYIDEPSLTYKEFKKIYAIWESGILE